MKTAVLLSAVSLAAGFVIPGNDQQLLAAFSKDASTGDITPAVEEVVLPEQSKESLGHYHQDNENERGGFLFASAGTDGSCQKWHDVAEFAAGLEKSVKHFEEIDLGWVERPFGREKEMKKKDKKKGYKHGDDDEQSERKHHKNEKHAKKEYYKGEHAPEHEVDEFDIPACPHHAKFSGSHGQRPGFFSKTIGQLKNMLGFPAPDFDVGPDGPEPRHGHHHEAPTKTIYEKISQSNHTRIFTRIINQYDEVVKTLNSTSATNYTVFVPIDAAFEGIHHPHHNISKEAILHWLEYHISPDVFTLHDFFDVQTIPTLRHEETESEFPQRISTSLTRKGLTLNFHSHVIRSDIVRRFIPP